MSILLSGDLHCNTDKEIFSIIKTELISKYGEEKYDEIKYHIILGDAGFLLFNNLIKEMYLYSTLKERPFPVLCVLGNHDPVLGIKNLPEVDIGIGNKVILVKNENPFIAYLKRGISYSIDGLKFLVLGGALSVDKSFRIPEISWWKEEYWNKEEKKNLFRLLKKESSFDYVLSHTGPSRVNQIIHTSMKRKLFPFIFDEVASFNEKIDGKIKCKQWFCGHWHVDQLYHCDNLNRDYQYLYRKTALLSNNEIEVL